MQTNTHDVVIIGGGIVGSALALGLAQKTSLSIAVLEAQAVTHPWQASTHHHRVSAITLSSQRIFQTLKVWDLVQQKRISPFTQIQVWDAHSQNELHFDSQEIAEPMLGHIIENNALQSALREKLAQYPQVEWIAPVKLAHCKHHEHQTQLETQDGKCFQSALVIAADGANSWLRQQLTIAIDKEDYAETAIVANIRTALPHQQIARQIFLNSGPLAFLPLAENNLTSIVWSLPNDHAKQLMKREVESFCKELANVFSHRLGTVSLASERHSFPLYKQQTKNYVLPGIALVGDAAHTVHPLAGQGINIGLLDAACLVEVVVDALQSRRHFASHANLRRYERWRRADNLTLIAGIDLLKQLFASENPTVQHWRSKGLRITQQTRWLKNLFTRHAVGNRQGLPL